MQYLRIDGNYACTLVIRKNGYPSKLANNFMLQITSLTYPSIITLDIAPIPRDVLQKALTQKLDSVEMKIAKQQEIRNKNQQYLSDITRKVKDEKRNIERYIDEVNDNDQNMFFSQLLITIYANSEEELESRIENIRQIGRSSVLDITPYYLQQIEAFITSLPIGGR